MSLGSTSKDSFRSSYEYRSSCNKSQSSRNYIDNLNIVHADQIAQELEYLKTLQKKAPKKVAQSISDGRQRENESLTAYYKRVTSNLPQTAPRHG